MLLLLKISNKHMFLPLKQIADPKGINKKPYSQQILKDTAQCVVSLAVFFLLRTLCSNKCIYNCINLNIFIHFKRNFVFSKKSFGQEEVKFYDKSTFLTLFLPATGNDIYFS